MMSYRCVIMLLFGLYRAIGFRTALKSRIAFGRLSTSSVVKAYQDMDAEGQHQDQKEDGGLDRELRGDISYITLMAPRSKRPRPQKQKFTSETLSERDFGEIFRTCAPYIARHRAEGCVIHIPGHLIGDVDLLDEVMTDISILHLLGVHIVLVMGVREQLDRKIKAAKIDNEKVAGMRVTDHKTLDLLKEACGSARYEIERSLTRAFSGQKSINVVSGNFFYTAKPIGVRNGVDFMNAGEVRRVEGENIKRRLTEEDIILLSPVGYSSSGESFSVISEDLAASVARGIQATKLIFYSEGERLIDQRTDKTITSLRLAQATKLLESLSGESSEFIQDVVQAHGSNGGIRKIEFGARDSLQDDRYSRSGRGFEALNTRVEGGRGGSGRGTDRPNDFKAKESAGVMPGMMVDLGKNGKGRGMRTQPAATDRTLVFARNKEERDAQQTKEYDRWVFNHMKLLSRCVYALNGGVQRAHVIHPSGGSVIKEMYSRDGSGCMISRDVYEGVRNAQASDVPMIEEILAPLVEEQIMVARSRTQLEDELSDLFVLTRDGAILACGMLKVHEGEKDGSSDSSELFGEICCIAVHPTYRREGRGETILAYLERRALSMGVKTVFLLSTRTMGWFQERGYTSSDHSALPPTKEYDPSRGSRVYMKRLNTIRDLDSEELLWRI